MLNRHIRNQPSTYCCPAHLMYFLLSIVRNFRLLYFVLFFVNCWCLITKSPVWYWYASHKSTAINILLILHIECASLCPSSEQTPINWDRWTAVTKAYILPIGMRCLVLAQDLLLTIQLQIRNDWGVFGVTLLSYYAIVYAILFSSVMSNTN